MESQFVRLVICTGPATEKNLELQFVRFVIFTGLAILGDPLCKVRDPY